MKINTVLDCTLRITSRSREVILPLCLAALRHISSAGSSCGLPVQEDGDIVVQQRAIALGLQHMVLGRKKKEEKIFVLSLGS